WGQAPFQPAVHYSWSGWVASLHRQLQSASPPSVLRPVLREVQLAKSVLERPLALRARRPDLQRSEASTLAWRQALGPVWEQVPSSAAHDLLKFEPPPHQVAPLQRPPPLPKRRAACAKMPANP